MKMVKAGTKIEIVSFKHDQTFHRRWLDNTVLYHDEQILVGGNHQTIVEEAKKTWRTKEPAIFYFHAHYWCNIIIIFQQPTHYYFYCNMSSPFTYHHPKLQYIDYDIDVIVEENLSYKIVDEEEYMLNKLQMHYPEHIQQQIEEQLEKLQRWIKSGRDPFNATFVGKWYDQLFDRKV